VSDKPWRCPNHVDTYFKLNDGSAGPIYCPACVPKPQPSEERVMRAREVLAKTVVRRSARLSVLSGNYDFSGVVSIDDALRAMLAFADEGSGIGELRHVLEALTPYSETKAAYMGEFSWTDWRDDENGVSIGYEMTVPWTTIKEIMAAIRERAGVEKLDTADAMAVLEECASPDIDRSGLAQEVE